MITLGLYSAIDSLAVRTLRWLVAAPAAIRHLVAIATVRRGVLWIDLQLAWVDLQLKVWHGEVGAKEGAIDAKAPPEQDDQDPPSPR